MLSLRLATSSADRPFFLSLLKDLAEDENTTVVPASRELQDRGIELYRQRPDKSWSLIDCISFLVMRDYGMTEALSADRHFEQAGYATLLA
jgi:predicted nucleic acid-binding protein